MSLSVTYHGARPVDGPGASLDVLGKQYGAVETIAASYTIPSTGLYRCRATADHTVRFGDSTLAASTGGEVWLSGDVEIRHMNAGDKIYIA